MNEPIPLKVRWTHLGAVLALGVFMLLSLRSIHAVWSEDDFVFSLVSKSIAETGRPIHPFKQEVYLPHPLLSYMLTALSFRFWGVSEWASRLPGWLAMVLTVWLVYRLTWRLLPAHPLRGLLANLSVWGCALSPAVVKGSLMLFPEVTLLPFLITLFLYVFNVHYVVTPTPPRALVLALLFTLCLWTILTTPLALILCVVFYYASQKSFSEALRHGICIFGTGAIIFVVTFGIYCATLDLPFYSPFKYVFFIFWDHLFHPSLVPEGSHWKDWATLFLYLSLWVSPAAILLGLWMMSDRVIGWLRRKTHRSDAVVVFVVLVMGVYAIVGRSHYGYIAHQACMIPLLWVSLALWGAPYLEEIQGRAWCLVLASLLIGIYAFVGVGDPLWTVRIALRDQLVQGANSLAIAKMIGPLFFHYGAMLAIVFAAFLAMRLNRLRSVLFLTLLSVALGSEGALSLRQWTASYDTLLSYGATQTREAVAYIRGQLGPGRDILARGDILGYLHLAGLPVRELQTCFNPDTFFRVVSDARVQMVTYNPFNHGYQEFRYVYGTPRVQEFLNEHFARKDFGKYVVWVRR